MRRALDGNPRVTTNHGEPGWGYFGKHAGYDYGVTGARVFAPEAGTILNVHKNTSSGGNIVELKGRYTHRFLHLHEIKSWIKPGVKVKEGDYLAVSGATGKVTGPHLHHDVRKNGTRWNEKFEYYVDWEKLIKGEKMFKNRSAKQWYQVAVSYSKKIKDRNKVINSLKKEVAKLKEAVLKAENNPPKEVTKYVDRVVTKVEKIEVVDQDTKDLVKQNNQILSTAWEFIQKLINKFKRS